MINGVTIFDCSLREIGYQTGWNFTEKTVRDLYRFAQGKGIDYAELGFFHNIEADPGRGIRPVIIWWKLDKKAAWNNL